MPAPSLTDVRESLHAQLCEELASADPSVAAGAARQLGKLLMPDAFDALQSALAHEDDAAVLGAASALAEAGSDTAIAALARLLSSPDPETRKGALRATEHLERAPLVDALFDLQATETDWHVRVDALTALAEAGDARIIEIVKPWLEPGLGRRLTILPRRMRRFVRRLLQRRHEHLADPTNWWIPRSVIWALSRLGTPEAWQLALSTCGHPDAKTRRALAEALERNPDAGTPLHVIRLLADPDEQVRIAACGAAAARPGAGLAPALLDLMEADAQSADLAQQAAANHVVPEHAPRVRQILRESAHARTRSAAAQLLGRCGQDEESKSALVDALRDTCSDVATEAARALGVLGGPRAAEALVETMLCSDRWDLQYALREALARCADGRALDRTRRVLDPSDPRSQTPSATPAARASAAAVLGEALDRGAIPSLIGALADPSPLVRESAAQALAELAAEEAVDALTGLLQDEEKRVRVGAAYALGRLAGPATAPALIEALSTLDDEDVPPAVAYYVTVPWYCVPTWDLHFAVGVALREIGSPDTVALLVDYARRCSVPREARWLAVVLLGRLGWEEALPELELLLEHPDEVLGAHAAFGLGLTRLPGALAPIRIALESARPGTRNMAVRGLTVHGGLDAVPDLVARLMEDAEETIRVNAALAIEHVAGWRALSVLEAWCARRTDLQARNALNAICRAQEILSAPGAAPASSAVEAGAHVAAIHSTRIAPSERAELHAYVYQDDGWSRVLEDAKEFMATLAAPSARHTRLSALVRPGTEVTLVPQSDDFDFEPASSTARFDSDFARFDFCFTARSGLRGDGLARISVQVCGIEVGSIGLLATVAEARDEETSGFFGAATGAFHELVFVSYSRLDRKVAWMYASAKRALGSKMFVDTHSIRAGEDWRRELREAIDQADSFQLFWSESSARSRNVEEEWRHALERLEREPPPDRFVRPYYWTDPMPAPPTELEHLHFQRLRLDA